MATVHKWEKYAVSAQLVISNAIGTLDFVANAIQSVCIGTNDDSCLTATTDGKLSLDWTSKTNTTNTPSSVLTGYVNWCKSVSDKAVGRWIIPGEATGGSIIGNIAYCMSGGYNSDGTGLYYSKTATAGQGVKGSYIGEVSSADSDTYPQNGIQSGYWYVYVGSEKTSEPMMVATIDGVQKELSAIPVMVDGVQRDLISLLATVNGAQREVFSGYSRKLPAGYTAFDYLESDGASFIDLGFQPDQDTRVICDFQLTSLSGWQTIFGAWTLSGSSYINSFVFLSNGSLFRSDYGATSAQSFPTSIDRSQRMTVDKNKNVCALSTGNSVTNASATFTTPGNLYLFAGNTDGKATEYAKVRIFSCLAYKDDMIRDVVACKNPSGVFGMYDFVEKVFYPNAGSGSFTGG